MGFGGGFTPTNRDVSVEFIIDGGGSVITTGAKGPIFSPFSFTPTGWQIIGDQSGSIVVDVWSAAYPTIPSVANTIAGTEKPTLASAQINQDLALTSWAGAIARGDPINFNVDSVTSIQRATVHILGTLR